MSHGSGWTLVPEPLRSDSRRGWRARARWYELVLYRIAYWLEYRASWWFDRKLFALLRASYVVRHSFWHVQEWITRRPNDELLNDLQAWRARYDKEHPEEASA